MHAGAFESLIGGLYDAALDESLWPTVLDDLMAATGSQAASLWVLHAEGSPRLPVFSYRGFAPDFIDEYLREWVPADPTVQFLLRHPEQRIVHDGLVISEQDKERSAYYDWHGRHSDTRFRMLGQIAPAPGVQAGVALHRARTTGRYQASELTQFERLYAHLRRALGVSARLGELSELRARSQALLEGNPQGVVLMDESGRCLMVNPRAQQLAAGNDGLILRGRWGVMPANSRLQAEFLTLLSRVTARVSSVGAACLRVPRPSGQPSYVLQIVSIRRESAAWGGTGASTCVLVVDPASEPGARPEVLRLRFGLTPAEVALAQRLADGLPLRLAADQLGITYGTARTRLKQVFDKTGVSRQAELVRLVMLTRV